TADVIRLGMFAFIAASSVLAIAAFASYLPRATTGNKEGVYLIGIHKNELGSFFAAGLVLAWTLALGTAPGLRRNLLVVATLAETAGLFASVSRGAIIGALVTVIVASVLLR